MGWLRNLFSPKAIEETARSAVRGLDDIVYTEQEKAEKTQVAQDLYARLFLAATPSALSRRIIASVIVAVWAFLILLAALIWPLFTPWSIFVLQMLEKIVLQPMNIIVSFYFLKQIVTEYRNGKGTQN